MTKLDIEKLAIKSHACESSLVAEALLTDFKLSIVKECAKIVEDFDDYYDDDHNSIRDVVEKITWLIREKDKPTREPYKSGLGENP